MWFHVALAGSRASQGPHGPGISNRTISSTPTPSANHTAAPSPATGRKMLRAMAEHDARTSTLPIHYQVLILPPACAPASMPMTSLQASADQPGTEV